MFFGGDIMDVSVTVKNGVVKMHGIFGLLLVVSKWTSEKNM